MSVINRKFEKWATGYSGCNGGDVGSVVRRSLWVCGLEWGTGHTSAELFEEMESDVTLPPKGYETAGHNLAECSFNRQTTKLLAAIHGKPVEMYEDFAHEFKPFVQDSAGYFKMNLYPIAFKNTDSSLWTKDFTKMTGFLDKSHYLNWCKAVRFPVMRSWAAEFLPKLIVCFGKTYIDDFKRAFLEPDATLTTEIILNKELSWAVNSNGTLVVICPFPINRYGLNSNKLLQTFGERIRQLML